MIPNQTQRRLRRRLSGAAVACAAAACLAATAAPPRPAGSGFALDQVLSAAFPENLIVSQDTNRIAWTANDRGVRNVWVAEAPGFAARRLTAYDSDDGQELSELEFSSDGSRIAYVRGQGKNRNGESPNPTSNPGGAEQDVWAVDWAGGTPQKIDAGHSPAFAPRGDRVAYVKGEHVWLAQLAGGEKPVELSVRGSAEELEWSPDGTKLAFSSYREDHAVIAVYDAAAKSIRYLSPTVDFDGRPRWSPDGRAIAFVRVPAHTADKNRSYWTSPDESLPWSIRVADAGTGRSREVWHSSNQPNGSFPGLSGDNLLHWAAGGRLVFTSEEDGWQHLYSVEESGGTPTLLTPGACEYEDMAISRDLKTVYFSSNCGDIDRRHMWRTAVQGGEPVALTAGEGIEWSPVPLPDEKWLAYFASDARHPARPFVRELTSAAGTGGRALADLPPEFPADALVVPQQVIVQAADGTPIHCQLFLPVKLRPGERRPGVLFMHGGPIREMLLGWHYFYYYSNAYGMNQYLASRGYVVLSVNYRSGIGYGRAFRVAKNRGPRGASEYQDIVAAGRYLQQRPDVDPKRVGLWGGSYGGYLTAMGLARNSDIFAAGVDLHGVHDWSTHQYAGMHSTPEELKLARDSSPVASLDTWKSPVLLIQGDDDRNVDFDQMVDLAARLREKGIPFEQLVFPDEIHDFLMYRTWVAAYAAGADFFDRKLGTAGSGN